MKTIWRLLDNKKTIIGLAGLWLVPGLWPGMFHTLGIHHIHWEHCFQALIGLGLADKRRKLTEALKG